MSPGPLDELGTRDAVVGVDVFVSHHPALLDGVRASVLDLARDRLGFVGHAVLFG